MSLVEQLRADLTAAMTGRDSATAGTLRLALAAVQEAQVAGDSARDLTDDEVVSVLTKAARKHEEAAEAFAGGGRTESAAAERASLEARLQELSAAEPVELPATIGGVRRPAGGASFDVTMPSATVAIALPTHI